GVLRVNGLPERYPKPVEVTDDELSHAIERIMRALNDLNPVLDAVVHVFDVVSMYVQVHVTPLSSARLATTIQHEFAVSKRQQGPVDFTMFFVVTDGFEPDRRIPIDCGPHIWNMHHGNNVFGHGLLANRNIPA